MKEQTVARLLYKSTKAMVEIQERYRAEAFPSNHNIEPEMKRAEAKVDTLLNIIDPDVEYEQKPKGREFYQMVKAVRWAQKKADPFSSEGVKYKNIASEREQVLRQEINRTEQLLQSLHPVQTKLNFK